MGELQYTTGEDNGLDHSCCTLRMRIKIREIVLPLVYANLVLVTLPLMYCQLIIASRGLSSGLSTVQLASLFCNAPVLLSFLGAYCKNRVQEHSTRKLLCYSTCALAFLTGLLSFVPLSGGLGLYALWLLLLSLISVSCFFSQLASYAIIAKRRTALPPSVLLVDLTNAASASLGMFLCYYCDALLGGQGLLFLAAGLIAAPPLVYWLLYSEEYKAPDTFVRDLEDRHIVTRDVIRSYFNDERDSDGCKTLKRRADRTDNTILGTTDRPRDKLQFLYRLSFSAISNDDRLKNDLVKENPYLLMENDSFGRSLIDTDAQVIIIMNIIYVVTVAISQGVHCFFLVTLTQRTEQPSLDKSCFLYSAGVILSTAACVLIRPFIMSHNTCNRVLTILYLSVSNITCLFFMSDLDAFIGRYILSYCVLVTNCQLMEEVIDSVITGYYNNIQLPAMKSFSVRDYINSKVGFLHGIGSLTGPIIFGLIATDMEIENMLFTIAAIFTTLAVVTTPLSLLFVAAELR